MPPLYLQSLAQQGTQLGLVESVLYVPSVCEMDLSSQSTSFYIYIFFKV